MKRNEIITKVESTINQYRIGDELTVADTEALAHRLVDLIEEMLLQGVKFSNFEVGQSVTLSEDAAEYILSDYGQDGYIPPSGVHSVDTERHHDNNTVMAMLVLLGEPPVGKIVADHWPNSELHNYQVEFDIGYGPFRTNVCPKDLKLVLG